MKAILTRGSKTLAMCATLVLAGFGTKVYAQVSCSMDGGMNPDLDFGIYNPSINNDVASAGGFTIRCSNNGWDTQAVKVCVEVLNPTSGSRRMRRDGLGGGGQYIEYELYQDPGRTQVFGMIPDHLEYTGSVGPNMSNQVMTLVRFYGRIPPGQFRTLGTYTDTFNLAHIRIRYQGYPQDASAPDCSPSMGSQLSFNNEFTVKAKVLPACAIVMMTVVDFGSQTALTSNIDRNVTMFVRCTDTTPYTITMDYGQNAQGHMRHMRLGSTPNLVHYLLHQDSNRTQPWGNNDSGKKSAAGNGRNQSHGIYARVPPQTPRPPSGQYTDTVVVTIQY